MRRVLISFILVIILVSCSNNSPSENMPMDRSTKSTYSTAASRHGAANSFKLSSIHLAVDIDTTCGMPLSAGITDTMSHQGKIYGFCSPGCKQELAALVTSQSQPGQGHHHYH